MASEVAAQPQRPTGWRFPMAIGLLLLGVISFFAGAAMVASNLSTAMKALGAALVFPVPEVLNLAAVAVLGKPGYQYLKGVVLAFLRRYAPAQEVGCSRYRIGLLMFVISFLGPWLAQYFGNRVPGFETHSTIFYVLCDVVFFSSLFVLGGDFWDKLTALFRYDGKAMLPALAGTVGKKAASG